MNVIRTIFIGLVLIGIGTVSVNATEPIKPLKVYLGLGVSVPGGPKSLRTDYKTGFQIFSGLGYSLNRTAEVTGRLEMHVVPVDPEQRFGTTVDFDGGGLDMLLVGADLKLNARKATDGWRPFGLFGGGWLRMSQSTISTPLAFEQYAPLLIENQTRFYYNLGAGMDLRPVRDLTLFILVRYVEIRQDEDNIKFVPLTIGIKF